MKTTDHSMTNTDELKRLAERATSGPWYPHDWGHDFGENLTTVEARVKDTPSEGQSSIWPNGIRKLKIAETDDGESPVADAAYIAAANPSAILSLIEEVEGLRGENEKLQHSTDVWKSKAEYRGSVSSALRAELDKALEVIGRLASTEAFGFNKFETTTNEPAGRELMARIRYASAFTERHKSQGESDE